MTVNDWLSRLDSLTRQTVVTDASVSASGIFRESSLFTLDQGARQLIDTMRRTRMTYMIGNGGSLAMAMHMATDFNLAGLRTTVLCDPVAATSHANDFGVESIFAQQIEWYCQPHDILIALSCSGKSPNIVEATRLANALGMGTITFTGFDHDNPLRSLGELNFYVPAETGEYGFVQLAHEAILHAACDIAAAEK
jgi:D-sedoheptulose 7-phosphate isomerase